MLLSSTSDSTNKNCYYSPLFHRFYCTRNVSRPGLIYKTVRPVVILTTESQFETMKVFIVFGVLLSVLLLSGSANAQVQHADDVDSDWGVQIKDVLGNECRHADPQAAKARPTVDKKVAAEDRPNSKQNAEDFFEENAKFFPSKPQQPPAVVQPNFFFPQWQPRPPFFFPPPPPPVLPRPPFRPPFFPGFGG